MSADYVVQVDWELDAEGHRSMAYVEGRPCERHVIASISPMADGSFRLTCWDGGLDGPCGRYERREDAEADADEWIAWALAEWAYIDSWTAPRDGATVD